MSKDKNQLSQEETEKLRAEILQEEKEKLRAEIIQEEKMKAIEQTLKNSKKTGKAQKSIKTVKPTVKPGLDFKILEESLQNQIKKFMEDCKELKKGSPTIMADFEELTSKNFGYVPAALKYYLFTQIIK